MTPKTTDRRTRQVILPQVLAELERTGGTAVTASKIASTLKLSSADVRICLQNYVHKNPTGCVTRLGTGIFRWNPDCGNDIPPPPLEEPVRDTVKPVVTYVPPKITYPVVTTRTFTVMTVLDDGRLLLQETGGRVWIAREV